MSDQDKEADEAEPAEKQPFEGHPAGPFHGLAEWVAKELAGLRERIESLEQAAGRKG